MKTIAISVFASLGICTSLYALPDYEPFADATGSGGTSYTVGAPLAGQVNAQGLGWYQAGAEAPTAMIQSGSLAVTGLNPPIGNSVVMVPQVNVASRFAIGAQISSGSVFYSFTVRVTDLGSTVGTGGGFFAGFNNTGAASQTGSPTVIGARTLIRATSGGFNIGLSKSSGMGTGFVWAAPVFTNNEIIFIVASYDFGVLATQGDDSCRMWVNPDPGTFGSNSPPDGPLTLTNALGNDAITSGSLQSFLLYARPNTLFPNQLNVDELYIGTSWAEVTPSGPKIGTQPQSQRALPGNTATFSVSAVGAAGYQWRFNGTDLPGAQGASLTLNNVQAANSGSYQVVVTNGSAGVTSSVATLSVIPDIYPRLRPLWSIIPQTTNDPFVTVDGSNFPNQRSIAYNALSNQLLVVSRTNSVTGATNPMIYVLDAATGTNLYTLDTSAVVNGGVAGSPPLTLVCIDVADDGAVYAANVSTANSGDNQFNLYRWPDSAPNQTGTRVYQGTPTGDNIVRWGDTLKARGSGTATEVIADSNDGAWVALFTPTDSSMTAFTPTLHANSYGSGSIGRSLQFGNTNSFWEKRKNLPFQLATYDSTAYSPVTVLTNFSNFYSTIGPVALPPGSNLLCALDFVTSSSTPDTLDLFEVSDLSLPVLLAKYNLPTNHQANANFIGEVIFGGTNVYVVDGNNGIAAFTWVPFRPLLNITTSGADVLISWVTNATGYTLYSTPALTNPASWISEGTGTIVGASYVVTNSAGAASKFYRLQQ